MLTDLILAIGHHILVFGLAAVLAAELAMVRPGMGPEDIRRVGPLDALYGLLAGLIIAVGFLRVFFGAKGAEYYLSNHAFWGKIAAFVLVGLLSIAPTMRILAWRRKVQADPGFHPADNEVLGARRFMWLEAVVFPFILIFAAAMARGYGI